MNRITYGIVARGALLLLLPGSLFAASREIADLQTEPLTLRQSVINQLSAGVLKDPYDEFLQRPYNLNFVNMERHPNLSPWPGQQGEQNRYVDFLIGNNGNANVRNGSDTLQGTYIGQSMEKMTWGVSAAYITDDFGNSNSVGGDSFSDGEQLTGYDLRFGLGQRITNRTMIGGGISAFDRGDEVRDSSFEDGVGGFASLLELRQSGVEADFGFRLFTGESRSWDAKLLVGIGNTELDDFADFPDDTGVVTLRNVNKEYDISDRYVQLSGGYNRRYLEGQGELQVQLGLRSSSHELDNTNLSYIDDGSITTDLELLDQDPVTRNAVFVSADTLFVRGWTQIFAGGRLSRSQVDGSTQSLSLGVTTVEETIDDTETRLALIMGLRQPLWNEKFRLVARARADWIDESKNTTIDISATSTERTRTETGFAIGIETVLNNMVFDLAWLFGGDPPPGGTNEATRQTLDLDRLVISATFGW